MATKRPLGRWSPCRFNWTNGARDPQATEAREKFYREVQQVIDEEARAPRP